MTRVTRRWLLLVVLALCLALIMAALLISWASSATRIVFFDTTAPTSPTGWQIYAEAWGLHVYRVGQSSVLGFVEVPDFSFAGFGCEGRGATVRSPAHWKSEIPLWAVPMPFLIALAIRWLAARVSGEPVASGRCPQCGYDLRASRGRCPECGAVYVPVEPVPEPPAEGKTRAEPWSARRAAAIWRRMHPG
jgi:hypothetical protein